MPSWLKESVSTNSIKPQLSWDIGVLLSAMLLLLLLLSSSSFCLNVDGFVFLFQVKFALLLTLALGFLRDVEGNCASNVKSLLDNASGPPRSQHSRCVKNTVAIRICNKFYTAVTCRYDNGCTGRPATMIRAQCCDGKTSVTLPTDCY